MKFKGPLIGLLVLAALGGGVWWSEKHKKETADKPDKDAPPSILKFNAADAKEIRIERSAGETTLLRRGAGDKWQIVEPKPLPADSEAIDSMVQALSSLTSDRLVEEKVTDLQPYGLAAPPVRVTVTRKDGKSDRLMIGDDTPTSGGFFTKLESDARLFTIANFTKTNIDKSAKDLRDKRLLTFDATKLTRVEVQAKGAPFEFGKNAQSEWQILKPKPFRADGALVDELVRKVKDARMDTSLTADEEQALPAKFNGAPRVAVVTVSDSGGSQTLEVRKDKDNAVYTKSSVLAAIVKANADLVTGLDKELDGYRDKKLFDFRWNDPSKLEYNKTVYQKDGDKWTSGGKQKDGPSVQAVIDKLRDLAAAKFLDAAPAGAPAIEIVVTSDNGKRVERVALVKAGDKYQARRENEPAGYEIDGPTVADLEKAAAAIRDFTPPKDEKKNQAAPAKK